MFGFWRMHSHWSASVPLCNVNKILKSRQEWAQERAGHGLQAKCKWIAVLKLGVLLKILCTDFIGEKCHKLSTEAINVCNHRCKEPNDTGFDWKSRCERRHSTKVIKDLLCYSVTVINYNCSIDYDVIIVGSKFCGNVARIDIIIYSFVVGVFDECGIDVVVVMRLPRASTGSFQYFKEDELKSSDWKLLNSWNSETEFKGAIELAERCLMRWWAGSQANTVIQYRWVNIVFCVHAFSKLSLWFILHAYMEIGSVQPRNQWAWMRYT